MKNFNLNQIQSNPDGQPTVKRQSRLMSHQGKAFQNVQMGKYCSRLDSVSSPSRCRVLGNMGGISALLSSRVCKYAAMLLCVLMLGVGEMWGDTAYGFENNNTSESGYPTSAGDGSRSISSSIKRTGSYSLEQNNNNTSDKVVKVQSLPATFKGGKHYVHSIAYIRKNTSNTVTLKGYSFYAGNEFGSQSVSTALSSDWTRIVNKAQRTGNSQDYTSVEIRYKTNTATKGDKVYIDDIVVYVTENNDKTDLKKPSSATSAEASTSEISWINGADESDSSNGATGVQNTLIWRRSSGSANDLTLNDQGIYSLTTKEGPSTDQSGHWTLVTASVSAGTAGETSSYSGTFSADDVYAIVHRDLAYNYSTPTYVTVPAAPSCTDPTTTFADGNCVIGTPLDLRKLIGSNDSSGEITYSVNANGTGATIGGDGYSLSATTAGTCTVTATQEAASGKCEAVLEATITVSTPKRIYMKCGSTWCSDSPKFFVHSWLSSSTYTYPMTLADCETDVYYADIPSGHTGMLFTRQNSSTSWIIWSGDDFWGQSQDIEISTNDLFTCTGWSDSKGTFSGSTYSAPTRTIAYNANGGTGSMSSETDITCGDSQQLTANAFTRSGWTFTGWNTNKYGTGDAYADEATISDITENITLYAQWEKEIYMQATGDLNWWYNGSAWFAVYYWDSGATSNNGYVAMSSYDLCNTTYYKATIPGNGYDKLLFLRMNPEYNTPSTSTGKWNQTSDITYPSTYSLFTINGGGDQACTGSWGNPGSTYTITFNGNGNTGGSMSDVHNICSGSDETLAENGYTREGWTFTGWNTNKYGTGTTYADEATISNITADITLYAQWEKTIYLQSNVSWWYNDDAWFAIYCFDSSADTNNKWVKMTRAEECSSPAVYEVTMPGNGFDKVIFCRMKAADTETLAWSNKDNQTENIAYPTTNDKFTISNGDNGQACTGSWGTYAIPTYTISYNKGTNGTGSRDSESKTCGVDFTLPSSAVFTRTGYTQTGWATSDGGDQAYALGGSYTTDAAVTFYPVWTADTYDVTTSLTNVEVFTGTTGDDAATYGAAYSVTLAGSTGYNLPTSVTVTIGGETATVTDDYTWNSSTGVLTVLAASVTGDITISATGVAKTTTLTFNANTSNHGTGDNGEATATYGSGTLASITHTMAADGYQLVGYYTTATDDPTTGEKIIKADGTLIKNTTYTTNDATPTWKSELSSLTLYARYEEICRDTVFSLAAEIGSAVVKASDATVTWGTSLVLRNTTGRITIKPKSGKFKNGDVLYLAGHTGNSSKNFGVFVYTHDGSKETKIGTVSTDGNTTWTSVSGTLSLAADADSLLLARDGGTTQTIEQCIISRVVDCPEELDAPTGLAVDDGETTATSLTFTWTEVENASSYDVYLYSDEDCESQVGSKANVNTTSKEFTGLTPETTYYCKVQAIGDGSSYKNSKLSAKASGTTDAVPTYTMTFNKGTYGTGDQYTKTKYEDIDFDLSEASTMFTRDGYEQTGWNTNADGVSGAAYDLDGTYTTDADQTFYPAWTQKIAVTEGSHTNGSISISPSSAISGRTITLTATPNDDYLFDEWQIVKTSDLTDDVTATLLGDNKSKASTSFTMPSYGVTVDATFTAIDYCSTFTISTSKDDALEADDEVVGTGDGSIKVVSVGDESSMSYTNRGLQFSKSGDVVEVQFPNVMATGSIIRVEFYWGNSSTDKNRGLTLKSTSGTTIQAMTWRPEEAESKKLYYTVKSTDTELIGSNKIRLVREENSVYLASVSLGECGDETYSVTYKANNGTAESDVTHTYEPTFADNPSFTVPSLKAFAGWNTKDDGTGTHYDVGDEVTEATTVYAEWRYKVLYLGSASESNDVTSALEEKYVLTKRAAKKTFSSGDYTDFALVVLSETLTGGDAATEDHELNKIKSVNKPILNLKSYFYGADNDSTKRWQWAAPNAGRKTTSVYVKNDTYANLTSHPIYTGLTPDGNDSIQLVKSPVKTVKPIQPLKKFVSGAKGYTLAVVPDGTAIHELTAAQRSALTGETITSKYLLVSLTNGELSNLHDNTKTLLQNAADYLISGEQWVPQYTVTFKATNNSNWSEASNWEPACVPTISLNAVIEKPVTVDITTAKAKSIVIDQSSGNTGSITIPAEMALVVAGTVKKTTDGETLVATEVADMHIGSSSAGNGSLVMGSHDGTNKAQVDFYTKARKTAENNWVNQYIGTPFNVADGRGVKEDYYGSYLYSFNFSNQSWDNIKDEDYHFTPFLGYNIIRKDADAATLEMQGTLVATTNQSLTLSFQTDEEHSENVLANSWTAPIKIANFDATEGTGDFANVEASIYIFNAGGPEDAKLGGTAGNYTTYSVGSAGSAVIPSMQSFSVYATAASPSLTLNYARLVYNPAVAGIAVQPNYAPRRMKAAAVSEEMQPIRLRVAGESGYADELKIYLHEDFSDAFENGWDAHKMYGYPETPQLYAVTDDGELAILCAPDADATLLGFKAGEADTEYTFSFRYDSDEPLFLLDMQNNTYTEVQTGNAYTFQTSDVGAHNRFVLTRFAPQTPTDIEPTSDSSLKGREAATKLIIDNRIYILLRGVLYDATGRRVEGVRE